MSIKMMAIFIIISLGTSYCGYSTNIIIYIYMANYIITWLRYYYCYLYGYICTCRSLVTVTNNVFFGNYAFNILFLFQVMTTLELIHDPIWRIDWVQTCGWNHVLFCFNFIRLYNCNHSLLVS